MKIIVVIFLFATLSFAGNPRVYSAIGDVIYNNIDAINNLKDISAFSHKKTYIDRYVNEVKKNRELGFLIESGKRSSEKDLYLKKLRAFSEINNSLIRDVGISFKGSIEAEDSVLFTKLINSGLLDIDKHKKEILEYYSTHTQEVGKSGTISKLFDENVALKKKRAAKNLTYQQIQAAKIKRIKDRARAKKELIDKSLEEELIKQKSDIRINQARELSKP